MKIALALLALSTLSPSAMAQPKVTEIRLKDVPHVRSFGNSEFVFCSNGTFYWVEGAYEHPIRHSYYIGQEEFPKLIASLKAHRFFALKSRYDHAKLSNGYMRITSDGSTTILSVKRGRQIKVVENYADYGPSDLWQLEMIVRGVASKYIGAGHMPDADSKVTSIPPVHAIQQASNQLNATLATSVKTR